MRKAVAISLLVFLVLYLPLGALFAYSFAPDPAAGERAGIGLHWYRQALSHPSILAALGNSLRVALASTLVSTCLGTAAALALRRSRFRGRGLFQSLLLMNLVIPEIVFALSLLVWFAFLKMTLGLHSILLAHITFALSYVVMTVNTSLERVDPSWEEAARDLGASRFQSFARVTFPLIWPGVLSAALLSFTLSFDDFLISFFTAGVGSDTLPMQIYAMIRFGVSPELSALSTLILAATAALVLSAQRLVKAV